MEVAAVVASSLSQTLKGGELWVIYLMERVCCQLVGKDSPRVLVDPLVFMLALHSMTDVEYSQWGSSIPLTDRVIDESDYEEFSGTRFIPSLILVCVLASLIFL